MLPTDLKKQPQEILPTQTSFFVIVPAFVAFSSLFQLAPAPGRESASERRGGAVVFSWLFQLSAGRGPQFGPERRRESSECSLWLSPFRPMLSLFHLMLSRVCPAPLSVEQVVVRPPNLVFGRSKSSQKR